MYYPKSPFLGNPELESNILKRNPAIMKLLAEWLCKSPKVTTYRVNILKSDFETIKSKIHNTLLRKYNRFEIYDIPTVPEVICVKNLDESAVLPLQNAREIIIDTSCGSALLRGAHIFAPGVIGMPSGTKRNENVNVFADLEKKCKKGTNGEYKSDLKVFIGHGLVKMQRYELFGENINPQGIAVEMIDTVFRVPSIGDDFLSPDEAILQNFPSIVCCRVLNPQPFEVVLDMCSAPGNKTTHIVELMRNTGTVVALDKIENRTKLVENKIKLLNYESVQCYTFDATKAVAVEKSSDSQNTAPPFLPKTFDRILLDAPCSAIGNRPNLLCPLTEKMLDSFPKVQKNLFTSAVALLRGGGVLVYSTCTITEAENEEIVKWALDKFPEIKLVPTEPLFGGPGLPNLGLTEEQRKMVQRFSSSETEVDSVGFFIAKFIKSGD